jgi:hypothetical protein
MIALSWFIILYKIMNANQAERFSGIRVDKKIFLYIIIGIMARPKKRPQDRQSTSVRVPMTAAERQIIESGAEADGAKIVTWMRETCLRAAKRRK